MVALARFTAGGRRDPSFGDGGVVTTAVGSNDSANAVAVQADGKIVVAGTTTATTADFLVARYNADGTPDTSFVAGVGYVAIDFGSADGAVGVAVQPDGKIVVAGTTSPSVRLFALAPLDAGGALDTTFGVGGKATTAMPGGTWTAHDMAL